MAKASTAIQLQKNSTNHWVLHSPLVGLEKKELEIAGDNSSLLLYAYNLIHIIYSKYIPGSSIEHMFR